MIALNIGNMPDQLATSTNITSSEVDNSAIGVVKSQYTVSWAARVFQGFVGWHAFFFRPVADVILYAMMHVLHKNYS